MTEVTEHTHVCVSRKKTNTAEFVLCSISTIPVETKVYVPIEAIKYGVGGLSDQHMNDAEFLCIWILYLYCQIKTNPDLDKQRLFKEKRENVPISEIYKHLKIE